MPSSNIKSPLSLLAVKYEWLLLLILLAALSYSFVVTTLDVRTVWLDEVTVADPAVNLAMGKGFVSTGWQYQTKEEFWASNAPLHQIALYHWIKIFKFSPESVRSINLLFMAATVFILWHLAKSTQFVNTLGGRGLLVALLLGSAGMTISYAWGRYDTIGIMLVSLLAYGIIRKDSVVSLPIIAIASALIPWAGINLIPYLFILAASAIYVFGVVERKQHYLLALFSLMLGLVFLYMLYATNGVAHRLIESAGGHGIADVVDKNAHVNAGSFHDKVLWTLKNLPGIIFKRISGIPNWYLVNKSYLLYCGLICSFFILIKKDKIEATPLELSALKLCALIAVLVPLALGILRNYPFYYTWMAVLPLSFALPRFLLKINSINNYVKIGTLGLVFISLAIAVNSSFLPKAGKHHMKQEFLTLAKFLSEHIHSKDQVYTEFAAYYGLIPIAGQVYLPTYKDMITKKEKMELNALITTRDKFDVAQSIWGGEWYEYARNCGQAPYDLSIYRRKTQAEPPLTIRNSLNCE